MGVYLGIPLITRRLRIAHFSDLQQKVLGKLGGWKGRLLSLAGRVCLVSSVVLPTVQYVLIGLFPLRFWIELQIRSFIWDQFESGIILGGTSYVRAGFLEVLKLFRLGTRLKHS